MVNDRYSRQTRFQAIGKIGQEKIKHKHVLIIGCGALGSANAESLVRAGIGKLTIADRDYVEESNLQRQQLFTEADVAAQLPKAIAAKQHLLEINHQVVIHAHVMDVTGMSLPSLLPTVDVVIDATDNFDTRLLLNDMLHKYKIPWVFGACVGSTGMSYTMIPNQTPCLRCLLATIPVTGMTCDAVGVIAPAVQMVVAHQNTEVLKLLTNADTAIRASFITFDLWNNLYQSIQVDQAKRRDCPTCGRYPTYPALDYKQQLKSEVLCGRDTVQLRRTDMYSFNDLAKRLKSFEDFKRNDFLVSVHYQSCRIVFFQDGRTLIHGTNSITEAKRIYYQLIG